jgi:Response regulator of the LytR/AlgR family
MLIPVTRDKDNQTEVIMLDLNDVLFMHMEDRTVVYHTLNEQFYHLVPSLSIMARHSEAYGFEKLDRINLVNMNKIKYFDDELAIVYFEPKEQITKKSKYATVAFLNKSKLKKKLSEKKKEDNEE